MTFDTLGWTLHVTFATATRNLIKGWALGLFVL